jgi:hypothetical protein
MALSKAVVVDVPTGYVNVHPEVYAKQASGWTAEAWLDREGLEFEARKQAVETLACKVAQRFKAPAEEP